MRCRALLASAASALGGGLAGCLDAVGGDPTPVRPDDCPTSLDLGVERPDDLTEESAASFAAAYEEAYLRRERTPEGTEHTDTSASVQSVADHGAGYAVELDVVHGWCGTPGDEEGTPICSDYWGDVLYYVDPVVVRRTSGPDEDDVDPTAGNLVECQ